MNVAPIEHGVNLGGRHRQPLPADPARARKVLSDREYRARKSAEWFGGARPGLVFPELARKAWR